MIVIRWLFILFKHRYLSRGKKMIGWISCIWILSFADFIKRLVFGAGPYDTAVKSSFLCLIHIFTFCFYAVTYMNLKKQARNLRLQQGSSTGNRTQELRLLNEQHFLNTILIINAIATLTLMPFDHGWKRVKDSCRVSPELE